MLSAGNLNTAALTLFLALHLTAKPTLPWLLLDDPVQSMDEVHVAQLAAVLRTLTRQHKRRIIIAVHEQALFDYLVLELQPGHAKGQPHRRGDDPQPGWGHDPDAIKTEIQERPGARRGVSPKSCEGRATLQAPCPAFRRSSLSWGRSFAGCSRRPTLRRTACATRYSPSRQP